MDIITYPVLFEKVEDMYLVTVPDIGQMTQGNDLTDAIAMARDLISLWVMDLEDSKQKVPKPGSIKFNVPEGAFVSYVDANITEYRKKYGYKIVKKNCSIPAWLNTKAEELGLNFSKILQEALIEKISANHPYR